MYIIKSWTRDFRGREIITSEKHINTYKFKRMGIRFNLKLIWCQLYEEFIETAYIPDSIFEYNQLRIIANRCIRGDYGDGDIRKKNLEALGYNYFKVQSVVNYLVGDYNLFTKNDWEGCDINAK